MSKKKVKYATGRGSRVKYSTSMAWDEWEKKKRKHPVRYSTGEDSRLLHSTGRELDMKVMIKLFEEEKKKIEQKLEKEGNKKSPPKPLKKLTIDY